MKLVMGMQNMRQSANINEVELKNKAPVFQQMGEGRNFESKSIINLMKDYQQDVWGMLRKENNAG